MGASLLTTIASITRSVLTGLVLAGLLLVPVTCTMVGHPHSVFDVPGERNASRSHVAHAVGAPGASGFHFDDTRPPLADTATDLILPDLHPGTVTLWLADQAAAVANTAGLPGLPTVTTSAMVLVASTLSALPVSLLALLVTVLVTTLSLSGPLAMTGRTMKVPAPPPRRFAIV
jgi:hypothetical protein